MWCCVEIYALDWMNSLSYMHITIKSAYFALFSVIILHTTCRLIYLKLRNPIWQTCIICLPLPILITESFALHYLFAFSQSLQVTSENSFYRLEEGICHSVWVNVREMPNFGDIRNLSDTNHKRFWLTSSEWIASASGRKNKPDQQSNQVKFIIGMSVVSWSEERGISFCCNRWSVFFYRSIII